MPWLPGRVTIEDAEGPGMLCAGFYAACAQHAHPLKAVDDVLY